MMMMMNNDSVRICIKNEGEAPMQKWLGLKHAIASHHIHMPYITVA